jgi:hypothetical protein
MTTTLRRRAVLGSAAIVLAGFAATAVAQPGFGPNGRGSGMMGPGGGGPGGGPGHGPGMMGPNWNTANYLDSVKSELAITKAQEPAWQKYAEIVTGVGEQMQGVHQTMFDAMGTATWEERRDMMNTMFHARQQAFETVHEAAMALLPDLTPTQNAKAQLMLPGLAYRGGMMRRGGPPYMPR